MYLSAAYYQGKYPQEEYEFFNRGISGNALQDLSKRWNEDVEKDVKGLIADSVAQDPTNALLPYNRSSVDGLVDQLENLIQKAA